MNNKIENTVSDEMMKARLAFLLTSVMVSLPMATLVRMHPSKILGVIGAIITISTFIVLGKAHRKGNPYEAEKYILTILFYLLQAVQIQVSHQVEVICLMGMTGILGILAMYDDKKVTYISLVCGIFLINYTYFMNPDSILSSMSFITVLLMQVYYIIMATGLGKINSLLTKLMGEVKVRVQDSEQKAERIEGLIENIQTATNSLSKIGDTVKSNMGSIDDASNHITISIEECTEGIIEENRNVEKIDETLEEIYKHIESAINSSDDMLAYSETTKKTTEEGLKKAENLFENMDKVSEATQKTQEAITELMEQMDSVDTILQTIKKISDQTNLLSFNASIESARVGEHGKGFAVVANNIRELANQSKQSTMDVSEIFVRFGELIDLVRENMDIEQKSVKESQESKDIVHKVFVEMGQTVIKTAEQTELVKAKLDSLSHASLDIQQGMKKITESTSVNSSAMQEVMARVEEQTASISDVNSDIITLDMLAGELNGIVNKK